MLRLLTLVCTLVLTSSLFAQIKIDEQLAEGFYQKQEYEKAVVLYEKIYSKHPSHNVYQKYLKTLMAMEDYSSAQKVIKKHIKRYPEQLTVIVDLGYAYH